MACVEHTWHTLKKTRLSHYLYTLLFQFGTKVMYAGDVAHLEGLDRSELMDLI